ncbi:MAG: TonB-dependent receptor [Rikenellaceae bacterium]
MNKLYSLLFACLITTVSFAQNKVSGIVYDAKSKTPLPGVTVLIKGTTTGVTSGMDGGFQLNVNSGDVLQASFLGMITQSINVNDDTSFLTIEMQEDAINADEVIVVGYGTTKKRDLAGSISSLKADDIKAGVITNTAQLIKGRAAGVLVKQNSSEPGGDISIRIRGTASISADNEPLYVVDGFQTDLGSQINPGDIQSIEILKDAAATSIYGARGANGVVLITTKKGSEGKYTISYGYDLAIKSLVNPWDLMDAQDVINYNMKVWEDAGSVGNAPYTDEELQYTGAGTDWVKATTQSAMTQNHQFSIMGGSDKMGMAISANYIDDIGILQNTNFDRFSVRTNLDYKLTDRVRIGTNMYLSKTNKNYVSMGTNSTNDNTIYSILLMSPLGTETGADVFGNEGVKPAIFSELNDVDFADIGNNVYATLFGEVDILKSLTARVSYTYSVDNSKSQKYYPVTTNVGLSYNGIATINNYKTEKQQLDAVLTWNEVFNDIHNVKIIGGTTRIENVYESNDMQAYGFSTDEFSFNNIGAAETMNWVSSAREDNLSISFFTRAEYVLKDKYVFNASFRADASSNFGANNKWGYFPSASAAWQLGDEEFMKFITPVVNSLKVRASYGVTGNDGIGNYLSQRTYALTSVYLGGSSISKGLYASSAGNPNLKWETTKQLDLGLDFTLLNNRIEVNVDYYDKITDDLLNSMSISAVTGGFSTMMGNDGKIRNRGFELFIKSNNISKQNFSWQTTLNLSLNRNKILEFNDGVAQYSSISPQGWYNSEEYAIVKEGYALSSIYGYVFDGIIQTGETYSAQPTSVAGDPKFKDLDGDGVITENDRTVIGDGNPTFVLGIGNNFTIKDFDFSFFLDSSVGNDLFNLSRVVLEDNNRLVECVDRWTQYNPSNTIPRAGYTKTAGIKYGSYVNSRFVEDASYLRLQNVELGYTLPVHELGISDYIKNLRVFVGAQNLFTITGYSGFNPEVSTNAGSAVSQGLDFSSYPAYRTFNFGAKIVF